MNRNRRGVVIPLVAMLLPALLIMLGFTVDLAHMQKTRAELRVATDNAVRAAASTLARTDSLSDARRSAKQVARAHTVAGEAFRIRNRQIEFGRSVPQGSGFLFNAGQQPYNAVRLEGLRTASSRDGAVGLHFGHLIGQTDFEPKFTAVAAFTNSDIVLVLDRSSSMKLEADQSTTVMSVYDPRFNAAPYDDSRWAALDDAVEVFLETMDDTHADERVAIVTYASDANAFSRYIRGNYWTKKEATLDQELTDSMEEVEELMSDITESVWNGNTYIEAGLRMAIEELDDNARQTADKKIILMTDGYENVGSAVSAAYDCASSSIQVHTITFGLHADQDLMAEVASIGNGTFQHAPDSESLVEAFRNLASSVTRLTE